MNEERASSAPRVRERRRSKLSRAMVLTEPGRPLELRDRARPKPGPGQVRIEVRACGVCETDLRVVDGSLGVPPLPRVPGHEIVGVVDALGEGVFRLAVGDHVGVPWLGWTCGTCERCFVGMENLCEGARYTGYHFDGGFAEHAVADARYCFLLSSEVDDVATAPLLCAGLVGYRALRKTRAAQRIGIFGFDATGHIVAQILAHQRRAFLAFTGPGDTRAQSAARDLGAEWAGSSGEAPPEPLDAALIFAHDGSLVPAALAAVLPGGSVVCGGLHMTDIPSFPYSLLFGERSVRTVANLTRADGGAMLALAAKIPVVTKTCVYPLEQANEALEDLRRGRIHEGTAVLVPRLGAEGLGVPGPHAGRALGASTAARSRAGSAPGISRW